MNRETKEQKSLRTKELRAKRACFSVSLFLRSKSFFSSSVLQLRQQVLQFLCSSVYQRKSCLPRQAGFTLIEVTVTVMLFSILMVVGTGAVLNTNALHQRTQKLRSAVDNLSFIMDDMARTMRTGSTYQCGSSSNIASVTLLNLTPISCLDNGNLAIALNDQEGNLVIYLIDLDLEGKLVIKKKKVKKDGSLEYDFRTLTVPEIDINETKSGFTVIGADPTDDFQPRVIIRLSGTVVYKDIDTTFNLQTTVSQRLLDI